MKARKPFYLLTLLGLFLGSSSLGHAADMCLTKEAAAADRMRALQSTLMVAALNCNHKPALKLNQTYNRFVQRHRTSLVGHADVLRVHFKERYGRKHEAELNRYVTRLANEISLSSFDDPQFCERMSSFGTTLLELDEAVLQTAAYYQNVSLPEILGAPCTTGGAGHLTAGGPSEGRASGK